MSTLDDLKAATPAPAELVPPVVRPPLRLTEAILSQPLRVMGKAKESALAADVSLKWWCDFRDEAFRCLTADADPVELERFLAVVRKHFRTD